MREDIRFYCGITEKVWNRYPVSPGNYGCVSPVMGATKGNRKESYVYVPEYCNVIQDSGAFCDDISNRLSFQNALDRQKRHAEKYEYENQIVARASYDLLIDEKWIEGKRYKKRWSEKEADRAVSDTLDAAYFLDNNRNGCNLVLSAQGVSTRQYVDCANSISTLLKEEDIFGLGGWCIIGMKRNNLRESFREILLEVLPIIYKSRSNRIHIWGVIYAHALGELLWLCDEYGIKLSTDSSGPQKRPVFGIWGYANWKDKTYQRPSVETRGQERARHVSVTREWLNKFRDTVYYKKPRKGEIWK